MGGGKVGTGRQVKIEIHAQLIMTSLAIVNRLRLLNINKVAVNCSYFDSEWKDAFSSFLELCGFTADYCSTLADQGLAPENSEMQDFGWSMTDELTLKSVDFVSNSSPDAETIVITGAGTRTLNLLRELEVSTKRPVIVADTVVYWAIAHERDLTLKPAMGSLVK